MLFCFFAHLSDFEDGSYPSVVKIEQANDSLLTLFKGLDLITNTSKFGAYPDNPQQDFAVRYFSIDGEHSFEFSKVYDGVETVGEQRLWNNFVLTAQNIAKRYEDPRYQELTRTRTPLYRLEDNN